MRGNDEQQQELFSYANLEERVRADHPLRRIRAVADAALVRLSARFDDIYGATGRPSIAPEKLLRALVLQVLYSIRSERALMDHIDMNLAFRWFVGLSVNEPALGSEHVQQESGAVAGRRYRAGVSARRAGRGATETLAE